jgi:hypothetical protein
VLNHCLHLVFARFSIGCVPFLDEVRNRLAAICRLSKSARRLSQSAGLVILLRGEVGKNLPFLRVEPDCTCGHRCHVARACYLRSLFC